MKRLQPMRGWRVFSGEVGVIVLGVLLALGAQQVVESWQVRQDGAAFRGTINREMAFNVYWLDVRDAQIPCELRKLEALRTWLEQSRTAASAPPIYPRPPAVSNAYVGSWNSRDVETYRQLAPAAREKYAMAYDLLANLEGSIKKQGEQWFALRRFAEPGPLSLDDRRNIRMALQNLEGTITVDHGNIASYRQLAKELGIEARRPQDIPLAWRTDALVCRSVLEPPPAS